MQPPSSPTLRTNLADPPGHYRWYVLFMMTLVYTLSIADRYVVSTLIEPIKAELHLSDAGVAFLTGVSLAIFYVSAGIPLAWVSDRTSRRNVISASLAVWSLMTAACGMSHTLVQFMLARIGVGIGEAGGTPAAQSLLADYFPWRLRSFAMSVFSIGASLGAMLGSAAGYVSDLHGWRSAFLVLGIPGVLVAVILVRTVQEPIRGAADSADSPAHASGASLWEAMSFVARTPALFHAIAGATVWTLWSWGLMWWLPALLTRSHHLTVSQAGGTMSLLYGVGGTTALVLASILMARLGSRKPSTTPRVSAYLIIAGTIPSVVAVVTTSTPLVLAMLWIFVPLSYALFGPVFSIIQNLSPSSMRAQITAMMLLTANLANLVLAPELVGLASDQLATHYGSESLRISLIPLALTGIWAAYHFWAIARHMDTGTRQLISRA